MGVELACECRPIRRTHRTCDACARALLFGQAVRLLIRCHLQPVLEPAQVAVRRGKISDHGARQELCTVEQRQGSPKRRRLQAPIPPAANELESLHDELDLTDAAGP